MVRTDSFLTIVSTRPYGNDVERFLIIKDMIALSNKHVDKPYLHPQPSVDSYVLCLNLTFTKKMVH